MAAPSYYVETPDGKKVPFDVPEGADAEQVRTLAARALKQAAPDTEYQRPVLSRDTASSLGIAYKLEPDKAPPAPPDLTKQGSISTYEPSLAERMADKIGGALSGLGVNDRYARHVGERTSGALADLTPVGAATEADLAKTAFGQGNYIGALGHGLGSALSAIPEGGAAKAMFLGVLAKNADKAALRRAEEMAAAGADRKQIWNETGWFQGADNKWRFEVPDETTVFRPDALAQESHAGRSYGFGPLRDAIPNSPALAAYPDLGEVPLANYSFANEGTSGMYHRPGSIMPEQISMWDGGDRSTALHEVQHAIQNREGFASGGTASGLERQFPNPEWERFHAPENKAIAQEYEAVFSSPQYLAERDASNAAWNERFAPRLDALEARQTRSNFKEIQPEIDALFSEFNDYAAQAFPTLRRADELAASGIVREPNKYLGGGEAYRRLAGEVEARNVQTRLDMTPGQRKEYAPWETEDVPREDQFVIWGGDQPQGALDPKWFEGSKAVNDAGEPLTLYHGTPNMDFAADPSAPFSLDKAGGRTDFGNFGVGIYTTPKEWLARAYTNRTGDVIPVNAAVKNPLRIKVIGPEYTDEVERIAREIGVTAKPIWEGSGQKSREFAEQFRERALASGYDGVITENIDGSLGAEVVAYNPEQLRRVTP